MSESARPLRRGFRLPSTVVAAVVTFVVLLATYLATAAPDLTFWDSSELAAAAHTVGIPHPPGTPLWVVIGHVASVLFSSAGPARAVTLLSVWATAAAGAIGAAMATRWIGARGAVAAAVGAGAMMTVWASATETEVYAVALLLAVAMLAIGERAGRHDVSDDRRARLRALLAFLAALAVPLHLSALVAFPAAVAFAWRGHKPSRSEIVSWGALAALALSAVAILPIRAHELPELNSGHAFTLDAVIAMLRREQYAVSGLWPRSAPLWLQIGNVLEWADWQVAFGLHPKSAPGWTRTPLTVIWAWLAVLGARALWRHDARVGRAMTLLVACGTIGVAYWLNMNVGPSYGAGILPDTAPHEARERDYFFVLGFWSWGMLAGAGIASIATKLASKLPNAVAAIALALAAVPLLANAPVMDRTREPVATLPRVFAQLLLDAVPMGGVLVTAGDNDTFPLWYLQQVEDYRTDVTVVTVPLLGARWYREELTDRPRLLADSLVAPRPLLVPLLREVMRQAIASKRALRVSALLPRDDRNLLDPSVGWSLQGLVYAPSPLLEAKSVGLDLPALLRARDRVPPSSLVRLPDGSDGAAWQLQDLLRCTRITALADPLLVSACGGA